MPEELGIGTKTRSLGICISALVFFEAAHKICPPQNEKVTS